MLRLAIYAGRYRSAEFGSLWGDSAGSEVMNFGFLDLEIYIPFCARYYVFDTCSGTLGGCGIRFEFSHVDRITLLNTYGAVDEMEQETVGKRNLEAGTIQALCTAFGSYNFASHSMASTHKPFSNLNEIQCSRRETPFTHQSPHTVASRNTCPFSHTCPIAHRNPTYLPKSILKST